MSSTTLKNTSGVAKSFSFLGRHGVSLANNGTHTYNGGLYDGLDKTGGIAAARRVTALKNAIDDGDLTVQGGSGEGGEVTTVAAVAATGTIQSNAAALTAGALNTVTAADGTKGVKLPTAASGQNVEVYNSSASTLKVYPFLADAINGEAANAAVEVAAYTYARFAANDATTWAGSYTASGTYATLAGSETLTNKTLTAPTLTTPAIGAATGTSLAATGALTSSGTAGIGYATGAGGAVTQITDKSTGVTLNKTTGAITTHAAALAATTNVGFTLTNSTIAATDVVVVSIKSGATANSYSVHVDAVAAGSCHITVRNVTSGSLSEALVINFVVIKGVAA